MKYVISWIRIVAWLFGLPLLGWWIAGRWVPNPPLVAPFLVTSPLYALWISFGLFGIRYARDIKENQRPLEGREADELVAKFKTELGRFAGRIALVSDDHLKGAAMIVDSWLVLDEQLWKRLSNPGREFMLIRATTKRGRSFASSLFSGLGFLVAFTLTSISLWFVLPIHTAAGVSLMFFAARAAPTHEQKRDRATLAITRNYKGAWNYIQHSKRCDEAIGERIEALKQSAIELGIAV